MLVETQKENLCLNQIVGQKTDMVIVDGDIIIPDIKPDILNSIHTNGTVCIYKKEVLNGRIRVDGSINVNIIYLSDTAEAEVRGINTNLDFTQSLEMDECKEGMDLDQKVDVKSIECKVLNGRKVNVKAVLEMKTKVYSNETVDIINKVNEISDIQMLNNNLNINSLVGLGSSKAYAKETILLDNIDNLAEILKTDFSIINKDTKVSYNKALAKADLDIKIMYLTEDGRINVTNGLVPIMGFIDIQNISDDNLCDMNYELKNLIVKPNSVEEHSIYIEAEIELMCRAYENKQVNIIQDLYSPSCELGVSKKGIKTMVGKRNAKDTCNIREKLEIQDIKENKIYDVQVTPMVNRRENIKDKIIFEGEINLTFLFASDNVSGLDTTNTVIPFEFSMDAEGININSDVQYEIEVPMQDFIVMPDGSIDSKIDLAFNVSMSKGEDLNIISEITISENRDTNIYSMVIYFVKRGDTLWNIAKMFRSTIGDIVRVNNIEDENKIFEGQQLYIPRYVNTKKEASA